MWRRDKEDKHLQFSGLFDAVIEPGEFAAELDQGPTVALRDDVFAVWPIVFCEEAELPLVSRPRPSSASTPGGPTR